jgi:hypothetical protein
MSLISCRNNETQLAFYLPAFVRFGLLRSFTIPPCAAASSSVFLKFNSACPCCASCAPSERFSNFLGSPARALLFAFARRRLIFLILALISHIFLSGNAELAHEKNIEWCNQFSLHFKRDRNAAARQRQN